MKKFSILFSVIIALTCTKSEAETTRVLFIGNSYIFTNNLPALVDSFFRASGDTLIYDVSAVGGASLQNHLSNTTTLSKINAQDWDVVILQEQSQMPAFPPAQVASQTLPYARQLDSLIRINNACTRTLFFMTWGRKFGDTQNCAIYPPICTFEGMQQRLRESYLLMRDQSLAETAPVGPAFHYLRQQDSTINLYSADNSHPSLSGSYLAAAVFYTSISGQPASALTVGAGIPVANGNIMRLAADAVCFDSLSIWRTPPPSSNFTYSTNGFQSSFSSNAQFAYSHSWSFGDGGSSTLENPSHTYAGNGIYTVELETSNRCLNSTTAQTINFGINGIATKENQDFDAYILNGEVMLDCPQPGIVKIYTTGAQLCGSYQFPAGRHNIHAMDADGIYLVHYLSEKQSTYKPLWISDTKP